MDANICDLLEDIQKRDERDRNRSTAPLMQGTDARLLDTTSLTIAQAQEKVLCWYNEVRAKIHV